MVEENKRRVGAGNDGNNFVEFALADETGRIWLLSTLDESGGDGRTGRSGELFELRAAGIEIEGRGCVAREASSPAMTAAAVRASRAAAVSCLRLRSSPVNSTTTSTASSSCVCEVRSSRARSAAS